MASRMRARLTYANVMATVAVFIALGGGAYAATTLSKNSVGTPQLKNNAVTSTKIKNSAVTSTKIKNGAVTNTKIAANAVDGSKVKDASLTGADINLATLPKVGSATNADNATHAGAADTATNAGHATAADNANHAGTADNIAPPEAWHEIGASGEPSFLGGSANVGPSGLGSTSTETAGFYKDKEGLVHLKGMIKTGTVGPLAGGLFNLPSGYRPGDGKILWFSAFCATAPNNCSTDNGTNAGSSEGYVTLLALGANSGIPISGGSPDGLLIAASGVDVSLDGITFRAVG
jgi:hypothetical protein